MAMMSNAPLKDLVNRLPEGVDYGSIVPIVRSAPIEPLMMLLLRDPGSLGQLLRKNSYAKILREISTRKDQIREALGPFGEKSIRAATRTWLAIEHYVLQALVQERELAKQGLEFRIGLIHAALEVEIWSRPLRGNGETPLGKITVPAGEGFKERVDHAVMQLVRRHARDPKKALINESELAKQGLELRARPIQTDLSCEIVVWSRPRGKRRGRLLEKITVPTGETYVERFNDAVTRLLHRHCRDFAKLTRSKLYSKHKTVGRKRPFDPAGWPVVTQGLIPRLYDELKPFYPARRYTIKRRRSDPGAYSLPLMKAIANILRLERPDLCENLTWQRVRSALKTYQDKGRDTVPQDQVEIRKGAHAFLFSRKNKGRKM